MLDYKPLTDYLCLSISRDVRSEPSNHTTEDTRESIKLVMLHFYLL